jgi:hypothetical protein
MINFHYSLPFAKQKTEETVGRRAEERVFFPALPSLHPP